MCYLKTIVKAPDKFQKDRFKLAGGVAGTGYLLEIHNHAPRLTHDGKPKTMSGPPLFFEKAGENYIILSCK